MKLIKSKKGVALLAALAVAVVAAVGAYAYWTTGGAGSGSATNGTTTDNLVIVGSGAATNGTDNPVSIAPGLTPGGNVVVTYRVFNPNSFSVHVANVITDTIANSADPSHALAPNTCLNSWFSFVQDAAANETIPANSLGVAHTGKLSMSDPDLNQNDCKSAVVTLNLKSN
jgi:hypothetical protein